MLTQTPDVSFAHALRARRAAPALGLPSREAALNWLALGLLLAAWNAVDSGQPDEPRPVSLQRYDTISARAAQHAVARR